MSLPNRLFFVGVPGSTFSALAIDIEEIPGFNKNDHNTETRYFNPGLENYRGHKGTYFGTGMEFHSDIETLNDEELAAHLDAPWSSGDLAGTKILKSHEFAHKLDFIKEKYPNDWIMLVYRPDIPANGWWHESGGFRRIKYPNYEWYKNSVGMMCEIMTQNQDILRFAQKHDATWSYWSAKWVKETFGFPARVLPTDPDVLVTVIK